MSGDQARRYLIAYDIVDDRRRTKISDVLGAHGDRIQYSVFIVDIRRARLIRLHERLTKLMNLTEDSILICDLGPLGQSGGPSIEFTGRRRPLTSDGPMIV